MALNVKQKYPGTQGGTAQLYASGTRLSLRRREQVFTRLSKSYKENMDILSTRSSSSSSSSSDEEIIVLLNEERRRKRRRRRQCRRYLAYIFFVVTYVCSARLFCVWAPPKLCFTVISAAPDTWAKRHSHWSDSFWRGASNQKNEPEAFKKKLRF